MSSPDVLAARQTPWTLCPGLQWIKSELLPDRQRPTRRWLIALTFSEGPPRAHSGVAEAADGTDYADESSYDGSIRFNPSHPRQFLP